MRVFFEKKVKKKENHLHSRIPSRYSACSTFWLENITTIPFQDLRHNLRVRSAFLLLSQMCTGICVAEAVNALIFPRPWETDGTDRFSRGGRRLIFERSACTNCLDDAFLPHFEHESPPEQCTASLFSH